ncbi:MAG: hypothetical protein KAH31_12590, partial [Candidatus Sabulitectum sp.]|nr:hypothetical protein [Candidatus Sabulitectum sp.]
MGHIANSSVGVGCEMWKIVDHPIHDNIDSTQFFVYDSSIPGAKVTTLEAFTDSTQLITAFSGNFSDMSGVSVIYETFLYKRRIHYGAHDFASYSDDGRTLLLNVINWNLPETSSPELGDQINIEGFEGESPGDVLMTFWEDDLEGGEWLPDSVPLYWDFQVGGTATMMWSFNSTGSGQIIRMSDNVLRTDRTSTGAFDRNIAAAILDLSNYTTAGDDLYIRLKTWRGTTETISPEEGVFIVTGGGSVIQLALQNFENVILGAGDMEFWGDLHSRHRIHCPDPYWGGNSTNFVTMDSRTNGEYSRGRMMFELDTSVLNDGVSISVSYQMSDHGDE